MTTKLALNGLNRVIHLEGSLSVTKCRQPIAGPTWVRLPPTSDALDELDAIALKHGGHKCSECFPPPAEGT